MGYSVAIRCRSDKLREKMRAFLNANMRSASELFPVVESAPKGKYFIGVDHDAAQMRDELSYDDAKKGLGFDYSSWISEVERSYIYSIISWMALKIGRKRYLKMFGEGVPHYVYDGCKVTPILPESEWKNKVPADYKWAITDDLGFRATNASYINYLLGIIDENKSRKKFKHHVHKSEASVRRKIKWLEKLFANEDKIIRDEIQRLDNLWKGQK